MCCRVAAVRAKRQRVEEVPIFLFERLPKEDQQDDKRRQASESPRYWLPIDRSYGSDDQQQRGKQLRFPGIECKLVCSHLGIRSVDVQFAVSDH